MLDNEYMKVYVMLMIMNEAFSAYMKDGKHIFELKNDTITVSENGCTTNEHKFDSAEALVKVFPSIYKK